MPGRKYSAGNGYRYGFNGQEKSDNVSDGNYTAQFWEYNSKIGVRWNMDPRSDASISPYNCFAGNPIWFSDPLGDTARIYGNAEVTNTTLLDKGGFNESASKGTTFKDAQINPVYGKDGKTLVGYNVYDTKNLNIKHPILQLENDADLTSFKENYNEQFGGAQLYYANGEPSAGMKKISASLELGNYKLAWQGIKQENREAWSNPVFVAQMILSTTRMGVNLAEGPFYRPNGGARKEDFITDHAYNKHSYQAGVPSTRNRTQFGQNIDIKKITETTIRYGIREVQYDANNRPYVIKYSYEFKGNVSTSNTPTGKVRVFINIVDPSKSTVFPLAR